MPTDTVDPTHTSEEALLEFFVERTGFPREVISAEATLGEFLGLRGDYLAHVLADLEERTGARGLSGWIRSIPPDEQTIARLGENLANQNAAFGSEPGSESQWSNNGSCPATPHHFSRFVFRTVEEPLPAGSPADPPMTGATLIVGTSPAAEALAERWRTAGAVVHSIRWSLDASSLIAAIDAAWAEAPVTRLAILPGTDEWPAVSGSGWTANDSRRMTILFAACRHWLGRVEQDGVKGAALVAVTSLGGDFGFRNPVSDVSGGGVSGLFKAIHAELEGRVTVKVIDAAAGEPAKMVAAAVARELASPSADVEVACVKGRREVVRAIPIPAESRARRPITPGGAWIITGGARGIMARAAAEIARHYGASLHLFGSRPFEERSVGFNPRAATPEQLREVKARILRDAREQGLRPETAWAEFERDCEIRETLASIRRSGCDVTFHACDVTDRDALAATLDRIRAVSPIRGILHGAGFELPARLLKKSDDSVAKTLAPRVEGTAALLDLTRDDPLETFIHFGSLAGRFGNALQSDYALSCDLAARILAAEARSRPEVRLVTIGWPHWDETGLSCRPEHRFLLDRAGVRRMSVREGLDHLIAEIEADARDSEVALVDPEGALRSHPALAGAIGSRRAADANRRAGTTPLIDSLHIRPNGSAVASITFDPTSDPFLTNHRDAGVPILPAVMAIESAAEAACLLADAPHVGEIVDVKLIQGFRMPMPIPHRADVHVEPLSPRPDGTIAYACRLAGSFYTEEGRLADPGRVFQSLTVIPADRLVPLPAPPAAPLPTEWTTVGYTHDWRDPPPLPLRTLHNGPALWSIREVAYDVAPGAGNAAPPYSAERPIANAWGKLIAPDLAELCGRRAGNDWRTPPSIHDGVLVGCDMFASHVFQGKQLPQAIERIRFGRLPRTGEHCLSRTICYGRDGRQFVFDLWLLGDDGAVLIYAQGVRFVDRNVTVK